MSYRGYYKSTTGYVLCLLPKMAMVVVLVLKLEGTLNWTWWWIGGTLLVLAIIWFALDQTFVDRSRS